MLEPTEEGVDVLASTATLVGERALMTVRWKRAGIELESWFVGGRMRKAEEHSEEAGRQQVGLYEHR